VIRRPSIISLAVAGAALNIGGCVTDSVTRAPFPSEPIRPAALQTSSVSAGILPLGSVPYDNRSLPVVSPDGRYVATQTGQAPEWATLLAGPEAAVPDATRIEVFNLDRELGEAAFVRATEPGLLLGRGADEGGFLVEAPRPDGARWIGYATWPGGTAQWLVADDHVNAFGCLGADGRLAWSRRAGQTEHFDLVIRRGGEEWTVGSQGGDWLLPVWSEEPDGLFALRLHEGRLEIAYMLTASPLSTRESLLRLPVTTDSSLHDAYQCTASVAGMTGVPLRGEAHLLFWHPAMERMALWRPLSSPGAATLLLPQSISAAVDVSGLALVGTAEALSVQNPANLKDRRSIMPGAHVPRPVARSDWPWVVLSPDEDRIGLMALRLQASAGRQRPRATR
jgi:hypothetical protein